MRVCLFFIRRSPKNQKDPQDDTPIPSSTHVTRAHKATKRMKQHTLRLRYASLSLRDLSICTHYTVLYYTTLTPIQQ
jgi:hypothetical protein